MGGGEWKEGKERDRDEEKDKRRCERRTRWEKGRRRNREDRCTAKTKCLKFETRI
jgi:hypothetical protein